MVLTKRFDNKFKYLTSQNCLTGCSGDRKAAEFDQEKDGLAKGKKIITVFHSYLIRHDTKSYRTVSRLRITL